MKIPKGDKKRLIACLRGEFHLLKPKEVDNGGNTIWYSYGKRKSIKGIYDLLYKNNHEYEICGICEKTKDSLREYEKTLEKKCSEKT